MPSLESRPSSCSTSIISVAAGLLGIGVVMVFSANASLVGPSIFDDPFGNPSVRQGMYSVVALVVLLVASFFPYEFWRVRERRWFQPVLFLTIFALALLVLVLIPGIGDARKGARRWLPLGPVGLSFQPSEIAKLALILVVASVAGSWGARIRRFWTGLLPLLLMVGLFAGLVGVEDFGTAALLAFVGVCMLAAAGARLWHLGLLGMPAVAGLVGLIAMKPYRVERLTSFMNPELDPLGSGYHQMQSLITIASGGWWGRGLGAGIQKYGYLPEAQSDFIYSVICEELGIIGGVVVIGLFAILLWQGRKAMTVARTDFGRLLAFGATLTLGFQAAMNIAVVTVSVPTKGIGLPLVSAGGTSVVLMSVLIGLLANVARHRPLPAHEESHVQSPSYKQVFSPASSAPPELDYRAAPHPA